jgi:uridine kinase/ribulose-5-phosphate 4-epimerase/fuculose-1-phosphate aldolase
MCKPYIIGIAGESGVGKSTIADIISLFYGVENTTIISTDDLHKWERGNPAWNHMTHLNPEANNLELGDIHLSELSQGKAIYRSVYNHRTGYFDPPQKIVPRPVIIVEGLHSFYTDTSKELIDLKIYVDANEELKTHWKIIRDTEERGYKYNMVLDAIHKRKNDAQKIREAQIHISDAIISLNPDDSIKVLGDKHEKVNLAMSISHNQESHRSQLFDFIEEYVAATKDYIRLSETLGEDIETCQDMGGNVSVKISHDLMLVKSSGTRLKEARLSNSFVVVDYRAAISFDIQDDETLNLAIHQALPIRRSKRPSMETGFHAMLGRYVLHAHPVYLTLLLCLSRSKSTISQLYSDFDYRYIEYANPGYDLYQKISSVDKKGLYFLENHGIILSSDDHNRCLKMLSEINERARDYIKQKCRFRYFDLSFADISAGSRYSFPDAFVLSGDLDKVETRAAQHYIIVMGSQIGELRYLSSDSLHHLQNMEAEKYRRAQ